MSRLPPPPLNQIKPPPPPCEDMFTESKHNTSTVDRNLRCSNQLITNYNAQIKGFCENTTNPKKKPTIFLNLLDEYKKYITDIHQVIRDTKDTDKIEDKPKQEFVDHIIKLKELLEYTPNKLFTSACDKTGVDTENNKEKIYSKITELLNSINEVIIDISPAKADASSIVSSLTKILQNIRTPPPADTAPATVAPISDTHNTDNIEPGLTKILQNIRTPPPADTTPSAAAPISDTYVNNNVSDPTETLQNIRTPPPADTASSAAAQDTSLDTSIQSIIFDLTKILQKINASSVNTVQDALSQTPPSETPPTKYIVSVGEYNENENKFIVSVYENLDDTTNLLGTPSATGSIETTKPLYNCFITVGKMISPVNGTMAMGYDKNTLIKNASNLSDNQNPDNHVHIIGSGLIETMHENITSS